MVHVCDVNSRLYAWGPKKKKKKTKKKVKEKRSKKKKRKKKKKKATSEDINHPLANLFRPYVEYSRKDICSSAGISAPTWRPRDSKNRQLLAKSCKYFIFLIFPQTLSIIPAYRWTVDDCSNLRQIIKIIHFSLDILPRGINNKVKSNDLTQ